jgi:acetylornithine deacetylase
MSIDLVHLAKELIAIPSVSRSSNAAISDFLEEQLKQWDFEVERLEYVDENGETKVSLVARKGSGNDGLALISHSDTVPGQEEDWPAFSPAAQDGRLIGRGSCDMKGPLAATLIAAAEADASRLKTPLYIIVAADEEVGGLGASYITSESNLFNNNGPKYGIVAEPTRLIPIYAHKGGCRVKVTAYGRAAHTSTDQGVSANFLIAPFLAEMAELAKVIKADESFMNHEFDPPTPGFNMTLDDGGCQPNVTAAKTVCTLGFRPMPNDRSREIASIITEKAAKYGFEVTSRRFEPFYISPEAEIVRVACRCAGVEKAETVPFGTDAFILQNALDLVILGPGDIAQAHTVGEWIEIAQLEAAVAIYKRMIEQLCM